MTPEYYMNEKSQNEIVKEVLEQILSKTNGSAFFLGDINIDGLSRQSVGFMLLRLSKQGFEGFEIQKGRRTNKGTAWKVTKNV